MEWQFAVIIIFGSLIVLMLTGMPIAICFILINLIGAYFVYGWPVGMEQLILNMFSSIGTFTIAPVPLFVLMGEIMFQSGLGGNVIDMVDQWLGRLPGRASLLAIGAGTVLAALTGVSLASVSILGSVLVPEMEKRRYHKSMIFGPILSAGCLAVLIPPSALAVLLAAIGQISVGKVLLAIIGPAILLAVLYSVYVVVMCSLRPSLAPAYRMPSIPTSQKLLNLGSNMLPVVLIIFSVIGFMVMGIATPEEAAASGAIMTLIAAAIQKRLNWKVFKGSALGAMKITGMIFLILAGARGFSQILAYLGATQALSQSVLQLPIPPIFILGVMMVVILVLGCFMESVSIILLTMPIFVPMIVSMGFDPIWFGALSVLNIEIGLITPPFGVSLYAMKAVSPPTYTMGDVIKSVAPFVGLQLVAMSLIIIFPAIATWLSR